MSLTFVAFTACSEGEKDGKKDGDKKEQKEDKAADKKEEKGDSSDDKAMASSGSKAETQGYIVGTWNLDDVGVDFDFDKMPAEAKAQLEGNEAMIDAMMSGMKEQLKSEDNGMTFNADGTAVSKGETSNYEISEDGKTLIVDGAGFDMTIEEINDTNMTLAIEPQPGMIVKMMMVKA